MPPQWKVKATVVGAVRPKELTLIQAEVSGGSVYSQCTLTESSLNPNVTRTSVCHGGALICPDTAQSPGVNITLLAIGGGGSGEISVQAKVAHSPRRSPGAKRSIEITEMEEVEASGAKESSKVPRSLAQGGPISCLHLSDPVITADPSLDLSAAKEITPKSAEHIGLPV
ncbi:unnamed protein product [Pleuronectes platessa]|uniref:Uncharacterized protein n=1 Tax=Pleuronectes platessa TaxID=8262 RepID=A0A9N7UED5_PLEPL|nr:unnamed protein product [Pleuronectes platessa]